MENKLRFHRKKARLTQQQMAEILGVSRQTVVSIELGKYDPSLKLAFAIARYFGVKIEDLFTP